MSGHPYRTAGEIEVPRPIEIVFKVSLFVRGDPTPALDSDAKLAKEFEDYLDGNMVDPGTDFAKRQLIAVEVKPYPGENKP